MRYSARELTGFGIAFKLHNPTYPIAFVRLPGYAACVVTGSGLYH